MLQSFSSTSVLGYTAYAQGTLRPACLQPKLFAGSESGVRLRSHTNIIMMMKGAPIYAKSFLQKIIADLSCYTETIALQSAAKQAMSVRNFFEKLQLKLAEPILIPMDTFVTLAAMGLSSYSRKCRHLLIKYPVRRTFRKIRDMVSSTRSTQNCNWRNIYSRIL